MITSKQFADFSQYDVKHHTELRLCVLFGLVYIISMNLYCIVETHTWWDLVLTH